MRVVIQKLIKTRRELIKGIVLVIMLLSDSAVQNIIMLSLFVRRMH